MLKVIANAASGEPWVPISPGDYRTAFESYGGSFPAHPRVVKLVSELTDRPVRYAGLFRAGLLVAALPLWGQHVATSRLSLQYHRNSSIVDVGEPELVLPIAPDVQISMPFIGDMVSGLHSKAIANLSDERYSTLTLTKGIAAGEHRLSGRHQKNLRRKLRKLIDMGAEFRPIQAFTPREAADIFARLHTMRWNAPPPSHQTLHTVFRELHDMLTGDVLFLDNQPVAIEHIYRHESPQALFVNGVQGGWNPAYRHLSVGSLLLFHNLKKIEAESIRLAKPMRYSLGWNDQDYKGQWAYEVPAYRFGTIRSYIEKARNLWWLRTRI